MTCDPHWTAYVSALMVPLVAVLGVAIAYRQWRTAQNKLKLDLFEKRFAVYDAARRLLSAVMTSGKVSDEEMFRFFAGTGEAKWLLSADVANYLDKELRLKMLQLQTLAAELEGVPAGAERSTNMKAQSEIKTWMREQFDVLDEKFSPFLTLAH
ncbi:hypothetical protein [Caballeronia sp. AZ7_KS35]|uniref:hypothetical protein n=1 Tax=Caballeronia sp. AZ7_KS35 TaxID=2921762 RepID=UPI0020298060|nr:hypothetical protein [Caballeronia sp. AZ7_KS35]